MREDIILLASSRPSVSDGVPTKFSSCGSNAAASASSAGVLFGYRSSEREHDAATLLGRREDKQSANSAAKRGIRGSAV